jgi:hypothetical protein
MEPSGFLQIGGDIYAIYPFNHPYEGQQKELVRRLLELSWLYVQSQPDKKLTDEWTRIYSALMVGTMVCGANNTFSWESE